MSIAEELRTKRITRILTSRAEELDIQFKVKYDMYNDEALVRIKRHENDREFADYSSSKIHEMGIRSVRFTYPTQRL
jgi:hypothetical protein